MEYFQLSSSYQRADVEPPAADNREEADLDQDEQEHLQHEIRHAENTIHPAIPPRSFSSLIPKCNWRKTKDAHFHAEQPGDLMEHEKRDGDEQISEECR